MAKEYYNTKRYNLFKELIAFDRQIYSNPLTSKNLFQKMYDPVNNIAVMLSHLLKVVDTDGSDKPVLCRDLQISNLHRV